MIALLHSQAGLAVLGFTMVVVFTVAVVSGRLSALSGLIVFPVLFGLLAGAGAGLGDMALKGVTQVAPTLLLITFAVLYFSLMVDVGLFDPLADRIVGATHDDPVRITIGTAVLGLIISFSGDGLSSALVLLAAFLPIYRRLGMDVAVLGAIMAYSIAVQNMTPWGGPTPMVATALGVDPSAVYASLLPASLAGMAGVLGVAYIFGRRERRRLAGLTPSSYEEAASPSSPGLARDPLVRRPRLLPFNLGLTIALFAGFLTGVASPAVLFPVASVVALMVNYRTLKEQKARVDAHSETLASIALLYLGAGIFTGILNDSGMIGAMGAAAVSILPEAVGRLLGPLIALLSIPGTYFLPNNAFYFGVVPVLAETAATFGLTAHQAAAASVLGQPVHVLSPLLPSFYVFAALLGSEPGRFLRVALPWAFAISLLMISVAILTGAVPLLAG